MKRYARVAMVAAVLSVLGPAVISFIFGQRRVRQALGARYQAVARVAGNELRKWL